MSVGCCSHVQQDHVPTVPLGAKLGCEVRKSITSLSLQPSSASVIFLPQNLSTFKLTGGKKGQVVDEAVCGIPKPCSFWLVISVLAFLCASHLKKGLCAWTLALDGGTHPPLLLAVKGRTWALMDLQQVSLLKQNERGRLAVFALLQDWG